MRPKSPLMLPVQLHGPMPSTAPPMGVGKGDMDVSYPFSGKTAVEGRGYSTVYGHPQRIWEETEPDGGPAVRRDSACVSLLAIFRRAARDGREANVDWR